VPEWQIKTRFKLKPGQRGTKKLLDQYGDALVCVRYRYDLEKRKQFKTIEIIISESDWVPPPPKYGDSDLVALRIGFVEKIYRNRQGLWGAIGIGNKRSG
jgi:hypothetical protein